MIRIFKRKPWKRNERGQYVPNSSARKTTIQYVDTPEEAREICAEANKDRPRNNNTAAYYNFSFTEFERE